MRYAVYATPPRWHPLATCGQAWLGEAARVDPLRSAPARYGFHATLKAPMALVPGVTEAMLFDAIRAVAARHRPFAMPRLEVAMLADFIALRPVGAVGADHPLRRLADDCVRDLDVLRAPLTEAERLRQAKPSLSERQRGHVERHGYAHVFEDWRFHMTLSGPLADVEPERVSALRAEAERRFGAVLDVPLDLDALAVFAEPAPGARFLLLRRLPLGAR